MHILTNKWFHNSTWTHTHDRYCTMHTHVWQNMPECPNSLQHDQSNV